MRIRSIITGLCALLATALFPAPVSADNPIIQTLFTADPAPLVHDGTVYLYTSHDEDDARNFLMRDWRLYTSTDMVNWTDHGAVASLKTFPWARQDNDAWAPQVIARGGKFYLYVPISVAGSPKNVLAVAVADTPYGPFKDALGHPLIAPDSDNIDPTVAIDGDGQAWLYWGNPDLWRVKLNPDMISTAGPIVKMPRLTDYQEGPWFYRRAGHYYMAYASTCCPEGIGYAMSDHAAGPWRYQGSIMDHDKRSSGNHPGIIDYKGRSYVFGFNYRLNDAQTGEHRERRSVTVTEFRYNKDGTIPMQPWWDTVGAKQLGTIDPFRRVQAETIAWTSATDTSASGAHAWAPGVRTASSGATGMYVTHVLDGGYIVVRGVDFGKGAGKTFEATVAAARGGAGIDLRLDGLAGPRVATLAVPATGGPETWRTVSAPLARTRGVHDVFLVFHGTPGESLFNFDAWRIGTGRGGHQAPR
ncbi:glycoside hydrolase family 43 protein [Sphingomonas sp. H39-1-10]|uniref:glycoside hydrolase family 43 protein n=1 Tax=Sphingomonas pollutisoli TaxID=3030829 RepID=UPI0023BA2818|nr:glycoside hydrolase family 43 protein [Sphingomonas pollutisoli]MDF0488181.1 glycoside hydrolase family 43 protein [Sphingomonas pollutisoli]